MIKVYSEDMKQPDLDDMARTITGQDGKTYRFDAEGYCDAADNSGLDLVFQLVEGKPVTPDIIKKANMVFEDGPLVEWFATADMIGQTISCPDGHTIIHFLEHEGRARGVGPTTCGLEGIDPYVKGGPAEAVQTATPVAPPKPTGRAFKPYTQEEEFASDPDDPDPDLTESPTVEFEKEPKKDAPKAAEAKPMAAVSVRKKAADAARKAVSAGR